MLISLKELIQELTREELDKLLSSFICVLDTDIEFFLKHRAVNFEQLSKSRTYLILREDDVKNNSLNNLTIMGYVTLTLKVLTVPKDTSNRVRKDIDGLCAKSHGEQISAFPVYLIGQLGRNSLISYQELPGQHLLSSAYKIIQTAATAVGGRFILVECRNLESLISFYQNNGFCKISNLPNQYNSLIQMIRRI